MNPSGKHEKDFQELIQQKIKKFDEEREAVFSKAWSAPSFGIPCYQVSPMNDAWYILIILPEMPTKIIPYPVPYQTEAAAWLACWEIFGVSSLRSDAPPSLQSGKDKNVERSETEEPKK